MMMKKTMAVVAAGLALVALGGCGSSVAIDDHSAGTGGSGGGSTTSGTGGELCAGFDNEEGVTSVTVRFRNDSPQPVYLPRGCVGIYYTILLAGGSEDTDYTSDGSCGPTCEDLQTHPPVACEQCPQSAYRLDPGATHEAVWKGTGLQSGIKMPAACHAYPPPYSECRRRVAAPPGNYLVTATGFDSCSGCKCDAQGMCTDKPSGAPVQADAGQLAFPSASEVDVVFGVCAFGCPKD
jgi:hypothetical protein